MKVKKISPIAFALAITCIPALGGCGKSNSGSGTIGSYPGAIGSGIGGCVPINAPQIPFTANNIYFSSVNIRAGMIPGSGAVGQVIVGGAAVGGPYQRSGVDGVISMSITPTSSMYPTTYPSISAYPTTGTNTGPTIASASGFVTISTITQQDILYKFNGTSGYNTYLPGVVPQTMATNYPCVSGIAIDVGHYYNTIYGGRVYLYLNNSQHGYALYF